MIVIFTILFTAGCLGKPRHIIKDNAPLYLSLENESRPDRRMKRTTMNSPIEVEESDSPNYYRVKINVVTDNFEGTVKEYMYKRDFALKPETTTLEDFYNYAPIVEQHFYKKSNLILMIII